ncbi:mediator of RNA polymerase II transcription subunit 14 [Ischnura elegans]|uniref:mediator of RNA polymerase II transcription subunit 14 n=1 Tax=Ischnura elegans TaxID=197161 RepID=UPI001ED8813C|nr:mediator of RNA polymerase II transcription subunit 14 [Ischnura elegans]
MAPVPLEGHQTPVGNSIPPQEARSGGSISLGMLIDFIVQRTYHELTVLAELLPRKTDMERKIEIYNFSARTRQLFVRLLALVKWANSASKVDKSAHIMAFLDKQSHLFVETADMLARMARETLVHARLPNFHIPAAVEVLTTGTYGRLPTCIRERIVPPDPITPSERRLTLLRLNQVIQHRLVTSNLLPQMRNLKIEGGRVTFHVEHEFEVSLTVMGDGPNIPWRLLDIDILVEDKETGDGKALVHSLQVQYVHDVIQSRLVDHPQPLAEVYACLHHFCQSLQLEVLYSQALRLMRDRLGEHIHIEEYTAGSRLTLSYWHDLVPSPHGSSTAVSTVTATKSESGYRLTIQVDPHDPARPLTISHLPSLGSKESEIADRAIKSDLLSVERLLVHTIYIRTRSRLTDLKQEMQSILKDTECQLQGSPAILSVPVLSPCLRAEQLLVTVETHTGQLQCHVPQYHSPPASPPPLVPEIQQALNAWAASSMGASGSSAAEKEKLKALLTELRFWITQRRCEKTLQHLPATPEERLPLLHHPALVTAHPTRRMFVRLHRHPSVVLVVDLKEKTCGGGSEVECGFRLAFVKPVSCALATAASTGMASEPGEGEGGVPVEDGEAMDDAQVTPAASHPPKMFLKVLSVVEFDGFVVTHGPFTSVDDQSEKGGLSGAIAGGGAAARESGGGGTIAGVKRKLTTGSSGGGGAGAGAASGAASKYEPGARRSKHPAYFIPELAHVVALCDERIPFVTLAEELNRRGIAHQGLQVESGATALVLRLVQLPTPPHMESRQMVPLLKRLLSVSIRVQGKGTKSWMAEFVFHGSPLTSIHPKEQGLRRPVYFQYEMGAGVEGVSRAVDGLLADWACVAHLHYLVEDVALQWSSGPGGVVATTSGGAAGSVTPGAVGGATAGLVMSGASSASISGSLANFMTIKSYSYSRLVVAYGLNRSACVTVQWSHVEKAFKLVFGGSTNIINAHSLMREQLEAHLNHSRSLMQILHLLHHTHQPLLSICKLPNLPQLGVHNSRPQVPVPTFVIMPQSPTLIRIAYQGTYCLEIRLRGNGVVSIRDGAYSRFDRSHVVEEFTPTQGLKAFLSKYADESALLRRRSQSEDDNPPSPMVMESMDAGGRGGPSPFPPQSPVPGRGGGDPGLRFHHAPMTPPSGSNPHTPASPHPGMSQGQHQSSFGSSPATSFNLASPPSLPPPPPASINHPSPSMLPLHPSPVGGGLHPSGGAPSSSSAVAHSPLHQHGAAHSPLVPSPSPGGPPCQLGHSPAGSFIGAPGHPEGSSPFPSSHSPAAAVGGTSNWPGSPGMPRPSPVSRPLQSLQSPQSQEYSKAGLGMHHVHLMGSLGAGATRVLPQRSWAGAIPTVITQEALDVLCSPSPHPQYGGGPVSQLGRSAVGGDMSPIERFLGCVYMRRQLQRFVQTDECVSFLQSNEQNVVHFKSETLQCRVGLNPQHLQSLHIKIQPTPEHKDTWSMEEFQVMEKFFDTRVAVPPYKPNALCGFVRMLNVPVNVLRDFVSIMRLELAGPSALGGSLKWAVQWSLRIPPSATPIVPIGMAGLLVCRNKILFFLHITRIGISYCPGVEPASLVLPLVYDVSTNLTQLAEKREPGPASATTAASLQLKRFAEFGGGGEACSLFPAVRDLLANLTLPSDPQPAVVPGQVASPGVGGPPSVGPPTPQGAPAGMQMHSPMPMQTPYHPAGHPQAQQMGAMGTHGMMQQ